VLPLLAFTKLDKFGHGFGLIDGTKQSEPGAKQRNYAVLNGGSFILTGTSR